MFCPLCQSEYVKGKHFCPDCFIKLKKTLPQKKKKIVIANYEQILFTYSQLDIAFIKSLLDVEKINYFFKGEHFISLRPLVEPAKLMVLESEVKRANEILSIYCPKLMSF